MHTSFGFGDASDGAWSISLKFCKGFDKGLLLGGEHIWNTDLQVDVVIPVAYSIHLSNTLSTHSNSGMGGSSRRNLNTKLIFKDFWRHLHSFDI